MMAFTNVSGDLTTVCGGANSTASANCKMSGPISSKLQEQLPTCAMAGSGVHSFVTVQGASCCSNLHQCMAYQLTLSIVVPSSPGCTMHVLMALSLEMKHKYIATDAHTFRKAHFTVHYHSDTEWLPYTNCNTGRSMIVLLDYLSGMHVSPFYSNSSFSCFVSF